MAKTIGDIMVPNPFCVKEGTTLAEAVHVMREEGHRFTAVLVVNDYGELRGLIEGEQILTALAHKEKLDKVTVDEYMVPAPPRVVPGDALDRAQKLMSTYHLRHLPVVDGTSPVGIISDGDILDAIDQNSG